MNINSHTERMLVTVRTYPTPSVGHREVVCTAAVTTSGEWRRLYPMPIRYLRPEAQFKTWDELRIKVLPAKRDNRMESRRPHLESVEVVGHIDLPTSRIDWLRNGVFQSTDQMASSGRSIGPVWMTKLEDVTFKPVDAEWKPSQVAALRRTGLFDQDIKIKPLEKIPFEFRFDWVDGDGNRQNSLVISWEIAEAWRNFRRQYADPNKVLREKLVDSVFTESKQPMLFMGNHSRWRKTFMVCGWFAPPRSEMKNETLFQFV